MPRKTVREYWRVHGTRRLLRRASREAFLRLLRATGEWIPRDGDDAFARVFEDFVARVNGLAGARILEIGARAHSADSVLHRDRFHGPAEYVGFDTHPGRNVDVTGDAHELSRYFAAGRFDAAFSVSVFEHLAMPWRAVLELNKVLRPGGLVFVATHPAWPPHALPSDFWRFQSAAFRVLFHRAAGFELLACAEGLPCTIVAHGSGGDRGVALSPAWLAVSAIARKVGEPDPRLAWDIDPRSIDVPYPAPG